MPDDVGYVAELFHSIQHRLPQFHLNCSCTDCITVWIVLLVDWSIFIRLQNSYKNISLRVITEN